MSRTASLGLLVLAATACGAAPAPSAPETPPRNGINSLGDEAPVFEHAPGDYDQRAAATYRYAPMPASLQQRGSDLHGPPPYYVFQQARTSVVFTPLGR